MKSPNCVAVTYRVPDDERIQYGLCRNGVLYPFGADDSTVGLRQPANILGLAQQENATDIPENKGLSWSPWSEENRIEAGVYDIRPIQENQ